MTSLWSGDIALVWWHRIWSDDITVVKWRHFGLMTSLLSNNITFIWCHCSQMTSLWSDDITVVRWHHFWSDDITFVRWSHFGQMTSKWFCDIVLVQWHHFLALGGWDYPRGGCWYSEQVLVHAVIFICDCILTMEYCHIFLCFLFLFFCTFLHFCVQQRRDFANLKKKNLLALPRWKENLDFRVLFWFLSTSFLFSNIFSPSFSLHHFSSLVKNIVHWAHNLLMVWIVRVHDVWLCWSDGIMHFQFVGLCMHAPVLLCVGSSCPPASVSSVSFVVGDNKM